MNKRKSTSIQAVIFMSFVVMVATIWLKLMEKREDWLILSILISVAYYAGIITYDVYTYMLERKIGECNIKSNIGKVIYVFICAMVVTAFIFGVVIDLKNWLDISFRLAISVACGYGWSMY